MENDYEWLKGKGWKDGGSNLLEVYCYGICLATPRKTTANLSEDRRSS